MGAVASQIDDGPVYPGWALTAIADNERAAAERVRVAAAQVVADNERIAAENRAAAAVQAQQDRDAMAWYNEDVERQASARNHAAFLDEIGYQGPTPETDRNILAYLESDAYRRGENMIWPDANRSDPIRDRIITPGARETSYGGDLTRGLGFEFDAPGQFGGGGFAPVDPAYLTYREAPMPALRPGLPYGGYSGSLPPGFRTGPTPTSNLSVGQVGQIAGVLGQLPGWVGTAGQMIETVTGLLRPGTQDPRGNLTSAGGCPPGYQQDANGDCVQGGVAGTVARILPGGNPGRLTADYGGAVVGAWGVPALQPAQVSVPTLRCPPGAVLGRDNLCYQKGSIPRNMRKHPPSPRPLLSAADGKTLRRAEGLQKKLKRVAGQFVKKPRVIHAKKGGRK